MKPPLDTSMSTRPARWSALAALIGTMVCLAVTPFMASVWMYEPGVNWSDEPLIERTFGPLLESWGLLSFGPTKGWGEGLPYQIYGKFIFLVYLMMIPIMRTVRPANHVGWASRLTLWSWRGMYGAVWVAMVGDVSSYLGSIDTRFYWQTTLGLGVHG